MSLLSIPTPLLKLFAFFPLYSYPPVSSPAKQSSKVPTLWIASPRNDLDTNVLSGDVDCLKWQAYLALRGVTGIAVRWDVAPEGAIDSKLPNLHAPLDDTITGHEDGDLLPPAMIPTWVVNRLPAVNDDSADPLDGYKDQQAKDESVAWTSLLETHVRAAVTLARPSPPYLKSLLAVDERDLRPLDPIMNPPIPPLTGFSSIIRPMGTRINASAINARYVEAITSLAERLGTDKWLLGSDSPTALDAIFFAYLHIILNSADTIRVEVTRRVNLVAWEYRVRSLVRGAFHKAS